MSLTSEQATVGLTTPDGSQSVTFTVDPDRTHLLLGLSPEFNEVLEELSRRYGRDKGEVINMAVGLVKYLSDSAREGKIVGVASADQQLETEIGL